MYQMDSKNLKALRKKLPIGGIGMIAERTKLSKATVSSVFSGKRNNDKVIDVACEIITEEHLKIKERMKALDQILTK